MNTSAARRRMIVLACVVACVSLAAGPLAAKPRAAKAKVTHEETATYTGPNGATTPRATSWEVVRCETDSPGCTKIPTEPGDRFVTLDVTDATGQKVYTVVSQTVGSGYSHFCSTTTEPVPVAGGSPLFVWVLSGTCDEGNTPAVATTGEIAATFYNGKPAL